MVSSTEGSATKTGWKRRASAASFSMSLRYSSKVVAPTQCSSPRAKAGFSMLEASMAPSALPAPTRVCSSSMKTTISPSAAAISCSTAFRRSSNSPRNLAPAIMAPKSRDMRRLSRKVSGTSPLTMRWARPSTIAVLPTPGSPIRTGLFLVRRERTWMVRRISSSRPTTGIDLAVAGRFGQVVGVLLEGVVALLGARAVGGAALAQVVDGLIQLLGREAGLAQGLGGRLAAGHGERQQQALGRDVAVAGLLGQGLGLLEETRRLRRQIDLAGAGAVDLGLLVEGGLDGPQRAGRIAAGDLDQVGGQAFLVVQ